MANVNYFRAYCEEIQGNYIDIPIFTYVSGQNATVSNMETLVEASSASSSTFFDLTTQFQGNISSNYQSGFFGMDIATSKEDALTKWGLPTTPGDYHYWYDNDKKYGFTITISSNLSLFINNIIVNSVNKGSLSCRFFGIDASNSGRNFYGLPGGLDSDLSSNYFYVVEAQFRASSATTLSYYQTYTNTTNAYFQSLKDFIRAALLSGVEPVPPEPESTDPYDPSGDGSGYSDSGGGPAPTGGTGTTGTGGLHDDTSDAIPTPSTPSDVVVSSGLFTAYNPDASQLASFANALWNMQVSDINDVLRFLFGGDAFNAIIGLHLLPVAPSTSGSPSIKLGNWDTGVSAPKITSQYVQVPFGSLLLPEYWGNCIDYAPYTKIQLALPYIGIVDVDTDDVLGSTNTLTYNIDVLSGAICATLHCVKFNLSSVIYQWSGACAVSLPFSGASYNSVLSAIAGVAAAGMGFAAMAAGPIGAALPAAALAAGAGAFSAGSAASIMGSMKGKVQKSGSFGANSGALGIMTPYFILTRPVQSVPASWQADKGYPANISAQLGTVTGYTEVSEINLECSGTEAEKKEIIDLLKKGVLF